MNSITLQLIKKPAIYGMILLFSGLPLVHTYLFSLELALLGLLARQRATCLLWCLYSSTKMTTKQTNSMALRMRHTERATLFRIARLLLTIYKKL